MDKTLEPIPTSLISGYLGSGKTTLINKLLSDADGLRITVLVNDFGKIAIDEQLIANRDGDTLALTNGCMCCSIGGALFDAIDRILRSVNRPDHLIIETSGVADPGKIAQIAIAEPEMAFSGCLTLVDAVNLQGQMADKYIADTVSRQISKAQVLGITKSDLVDQTANNLIVSKISAFNKTAPIISVLEGNVPFDFILESFVQSRNSASITTQMEPDIEETHQEVYASWSYNGARFSSVDEIEAISNPEQSGIYRLKGYLKTDSGTVKIIHRAGSDFQVSDAGYGEKSTRLVALGPRKHFCAETFEKQWQSASREPQQL